MLNGGAGNDVPIGGAGDDVLVCDAADEAPRSTAAPASTRSASRAPARPSISRPSTTTGALRTSRPASKRVGLAGTGDNTLTLDIQDLFHLSDTSNTLRVDGNAGDVVTTTDAAGRGRGRRRLAGYTTYTNGQATLIVDSDITRAAIQA